MSINLMKNVKKFINFNQPYRYHSVFKTEMSVKKPLAQNIYRVQHPEALSAARQCLMAGEIIGLPTDTVYGLACDANNIKAIQRLYDIKGRDCHKPIAICVKDISAFRCYGEAEHLSNELLEHLLPGAITIIIERSKNLSNPLLNPSTSKIGIRIPNFPFIQQLCALFDEQPLALTSANRSTERSSLNIQEFKILWPQLGAVFDAGQIGLTEERRLASTVVDLSSPGQYKVIREGVALKETLDVLRDFNIQSIDNGINN